jgi:hypothetical protein
MLGVQAVLNMLCSLNCSTSPVQSLADATAVIMDPRVDKVLPGPFCGMLRCAFVTLPRPFQTGAPSQEIPISSDGVAQTELPTPLCCVCNVSLRRLLMR